MALSTRSAPTDTYNAAAATKLTRTTRIDARTHRTYVTFQWWRLFALTAAHFTVDMFAGLLPAILPAVQSDFDLSIARGAVFLAVLNIACNLGQVLTGHMRPHIKRPLFLPLGLALSSALCLMALMPRTPAAFPLMLITAVITGTGVAFGHPEGLRAVHAVKRIPPAMATAIFLAGGFLGYSSGSLLATALVSRFGFAGLYFLFVGPAITIVLIPLAKIRLAVEPKTPKAPDPADSLKFSFWPVMWMAAASATSSTLLFWLLPQRMAELDFPLTSGGMANMIVGLSSATGSFFWAHIAHRKGEPFAAALASFLGIPFFVVYFALIRLPAASSILAAACFCSSAAYPLMVTMARHARGFNLGRRMAFVVGGAWGIASLFPIVLSPVVEASSAGPVLALSPVGYLASALIALSFLRRQPRA